jgi:hypothetical protein
MKAPFWALCCAFALLAGSVFAADETNGSQNLGPTAAPLGRPVAESADSFSADAANNRLPASFAGQSNPAAAINSLRYPQIVSTPSSAAPAAIATTTPAATPTSALAPTTGATPAPFTSASGAQPTAQEKAEEKHASSSRRFFSNPFKSAQLSKSKETAAPAVAGPVAAAPVAAAPAVAAPVVAAPAPTSVAATPSASKTDVVGTTAGGAKSVEVSPWRPMQTAFRQISGPNPTATPQPPVTAVIAPNNPPPYNPPGRIPPQYSQATPPSSSPNSSLADLTQPTPADPVYANGETARQRQIDAYEAQYGHPTGGGDGGCGCGGGGSCGSPGDSNICPNCGGWHHGTCLTNNPEGSCVLQRFGCCLTKPYPDCSNGCVDFCHSWLFHEDDCWLTSNHKCPAPGCGPYPYGSCPMDGQGKGNGCGCGNCGPCIRPNPVYFSAEGLVLTRDNQANDSIIAFDGGAPTLSVSDFGSFDWKGGPSFILGYKPTPMDAWEISYFGLQDWNENQQRGPSAGLIVLDGDLGNAMGLGFHTIDTLSVTYSSEIHDAELNYFWHPGAKWLNWMVGFRYFHLDEQFDINAIDLNPAIVSAYDTQSTNNLYGGQLGARAHFCGTKCSFDVTGKAGAFGNSVQMSQEIGPFGGTPSIRNTNVSESNWAFVGQVGCQFTYNFSWHWYAVGGYDALWIDGVALAPNQLDFSLDPNAGTNINHTGNVFMHGAHVGIGFQW